MYLYATVHNKVPGSIHKGVTKHAMKSRHAQGQVKKYKRMYSSWNALYVASTYVHHLLAAIMSGYGNPTIVDDACQPGGPCTWVRAILAYTIIICINYWST